MSDIGFHRRLGQAPGAGSWYMMRTSCESYAKAVIRRWLRVLKRQQDGIRAAEDIEAIHQGRVASRRLRTAFWVFEDLFPSGKARRWRRTLRSVARAFGAARDLDVQIVFLQRLAARLRPSPRRAGLLALVDLLRKRRAESHSDVLQALKMLRKKRLIGKVRVALAKLRRGTATETATDNLRRRARSCITKRLEELLRLERYVEEPARVRELHEMRIAAKRLRYTLECFEPFYGRGTARFIGAARSVQTVLGDLHDLDVWLQSLDTLLPEGPADEQTTLAKNYLYRTCKTLRTRTYERFVKLWKKLEAQGTWQRLAEFVGAAHRTSGAGRPVGQERIQMKRMKTEEATLVRQALALAKSCNYERGHTHQVTRIALELFDQLRPLHGLGERERMWLRLGSLLHDIGWRDEGRKHHKIALEIIMSSPLLAVPDETRKIVGLIARYHRRALPSDSHEYYCDLRPRSRETVRTLSALLRFADGLDRTHLGLVRSVRCEVAPDRLVVHIRAARRSEVDKLTGKEKADLLEQVLGREVVIEW